MKPRLLFCGLCFGLALAALGAAPGAQDAPTPRPNLLFLLVDQMRGQALGCRQEDPVLTPHLDRLASEGLLLTQAVANYPVCSPSRAMLMTGTYPHTNGVLANCNTRGTRHRYELRKAARCWSDVLKEHGYNLGYIGKWHLDAPRKPYVKSYNNRKDFAWNEWCPPHRRHGFGFWYAYGTFDRHLTPEYWSTAMKREERAKVTQWGPEHEADIAIEFLRNARGKYRDSRRPFALVVSMNPPHTPYQQVPKRYVDRYDGKTYRDLLNRPNVDLKADTRAVRGARRQIKNYFAMVTGVDDQVGRILEALRKHGLEKDTLVVFTSDHGNCIGSHDVPTKNVHFEESMRVPFLVRWPGRIPARRDDLLFSTPDIAPTLLDLLGLGAEIPEAMQGASHANLFRTGKGERPTSQLYLHVPYGKPAWGRRGVRTHRHTLMIEVLPEKPVRRELYDNVADPYQRTNLAETKRDLVRRLIREQLEPWLEKTRDPWRKRLPAARGD